MDFLDSSFFNALLVNRALDWLISWLGDFIVGILIIVAGILVSSRVARFLRRKLSKLNTIDDTLAPVIASLVRYSILLVVFVVGLGSFGIETTPIIAALGAAGLAIALALQGTLSNVAAGVMLLFLRPFKVGDWIESGSISGTVQEIGLFASVIDTFDNVFISVPNSSIWNNTIINHSQYNTRRMDLDIGVSYDGDLDHIERVMLGMAKEERILTDPPPQFLVVSYGDSAILVRLRLYARNDVYWPLYWDMLRQLKPTLDKAGIVIPFPQREVRLINDPKS